ncbi:MAG: hypothetical protein OXC05_07320 [Halieaceae bacterium]|nr:hypothetical protein [Halieaceae bacterium]
MRQKIKSKLAWGATMPDIQMTEEQMRQVAEAQKRFAEFKATQPRLQQGGPGPFFF